MDNNHNEKDLEQKIMSQIESGKVKLRSRYVFWAQNLGLGSAIILSFLLGVLFLSLVILSFKLTGNLNYLSFGQLGKLAFLESFPYGLVIFSVICILLVGFFIKKSQWFYKFKFGYLAILLTVLIISGGGLIALVKVPEWIAQRFIFSERSNRMMNAFMVPKPCENGRGLIGQIIEVDSGEEFIIVSDPCGFKKAVFSDGEISTLGFLNKFIVAVGEQEHEIFQINHFRIFEDMVRLEIPHFFDKSSNCPNCRMMK